MLEEARAKKSDKRKADTVCTNREFELSLQERTVRGPQDIKKQNIQRVHSMNSGRPLQERLNIPDGVDVF